MSRPATGHGLSTIAADGSTLDAWYPAPSMGDGDPGPIPADLRAGERKDDLREVRVVAVSTSIDCDAPPSTVADAYLRLHLLSLRLVLPNSINLDGLYAVLPNVVWTSLGPIAASSLGVVRMRAKAVGLHLTVFGVDKFPRMLDYVAPSGIRVADGDRVRLGAHLAEGTTVMAEGFVNFNAGTLGVSMVEGRIAQGVVVADGSDVGGGASIMGTLSGGGRDRISVGKRSLLGANSGLGISIGDDCVVEAGLYLTAGSKVVVVDDPNPDGSPRIAKARELAGRDGLLFRRNSLSGAIEAVQRPGAGVTLNAALHHN